jgi:hypothetical protein
MLKSEEARRKIEQASHLAEMKHTAGWRIIEAKLRAQIDACQRKLCQRGLDHQSTEELRYQMYVMQWLLRSVDLVSPEQVAKWEGEVAFHVKQEKMREHAGLSPGLQELKYDEAQGS